MLSIFDAINLTMEYPPHDSAITVGSLFTPRSPSTYPITLHIIHWPLPLPLLVQNRKNGKLRHLPQAIHQTIRMSLWTTMLQ